MPKYRIGNKIYDITENQVESFLNLAKEKGYNVEEVKMPRVEQGATTLMGQAPIMGFQSEDISLESQEDDTFIERQFGKNWFTDFWGDLWRSGEQGFNQAKQVGETFEVFNKGVEADDETILNMINARKKAQGIGMTDEMRDFQRIYEEEGKGVWGFMKGVLNNPSVISQVFVSSMATLAGSALDSSDVTTAALSSAAVGAGTGAAAGLAGGIFAPITSTAGAITGGVSGLFGGLGGAMEAGLTFGELLEKELAADGKSFDLENVKEFLQNEEKLKDLKRKAVGRGLTIGAIEALSGGLAGRAGATIKGFKGKVAGVGIEAVGGGVGEIAGRKVADQEMDIAEIGFEAIGGTATAPFNLTAAILTSPTYKINGQAAKRSDIIDQIEAQDNDFLATNFSIKNDPELSKQIHDKQIRLAKKSEIEKTVTNPEDLSKVLDLETKLEEIGTPKTTQGKRDKAKIQKDIDSILDKYDIADLTEERLSNLQKIATQVTFASDAANKLGLTFASVKDENALFKFAEENNINIPESLVEEVKTFGGLYANGIAIINEKVAAETEQLNVGAHEILHGILEKYVGEKQGVVVEDFKKIIGQEQINLVNQEMAGRDYTQEEYNKEFLTVYSDLIQKEEIKYDEGIFTKIGDWIVENILRPLGFSQIGFENGQQVYNFMKEYQKGVSEGSITKQLEKSLQALESTQPTDLLASRPESENAKVDALVGPKDEAGNYSMTKSEWLGGGINNAYNEIINGNLLDGLIRSQARDPETGAQLDNVYGRTLNQFVEDVKTGETVPGTTTLLDTLINFNPEQNNSLIGWINSQLRFRVGDVVKKYKETQLATGEMQEAAELTRAATAAPETVPAQEKTGTTIKPLNRFATEPEVKAEYKEAVLNFIDENNIADLTYKTLTDIAPETTKKIFGQSRTAKGFFIKKNAKLLYALLPYAAGKTTSGRKGFGTATGIKRVLLDNFYTKEGRATMAEGTAAGLEVRNKKPFNETEFLKVFGLLPDQIQDRNQMTAMQSLEAEIGKTISNSLVREILTEQNFDPGVISRLADGKSDILASKRIPVGTHTSIAQIKLSELYNNKSKGDISIKKDIKKLLPDLSKELGVDAELIVYSLTGTGKDKVNPIFGGRYAIFPSTSATRKFLKIEKLDSDSKKAYKTARSYIGTLNITSANKFSEYKKLYESILNNDQKIIQQVILENNVKETIFKDLMNKFINIAIRKPELKPAIYHILNVQDNYTGHFLRVLHPLVSVVDPKTISKLHDEHLSRSKRTAHYAIGLIETLSSDQKEVNGDIIANELNNMWKGMYRGLIGKEEADNFSSTKDYGPQKYMDNVEGILNEMRENLNTENHLLIPNTTLNPTNDIVKLSDKKALASKPINLNKDFNKILEESKGVPFEQDIPDILARQLGKKKDKFKPFVPYSAEDFEGLMYPLYGKGAAGDKNAAWFKENLYKPLSEGLMAFDGAKQKALEKLKLLKKEIKKNGIDLTKESSIPGFTIEQAIRVRMWTKKGYDIPGINDKLKDQFNKAVRQDMDAMNLVEKLDALFPNNLYAEPENNWLAGNILTDVIEFQNTAQRKEFLEPFFNNVEEIFGKFGQGNKLTGPNANKLRATFGNNYIKALENILTRIRSGRNRIIGPDDTTNSFMDWVNNSVGTIMFFNTRSALLQTISNFNYINWSDNNVLKAGQAWLNQGQFWKDFAFLYNSDFLKARRSGLKTDVNADEIAKATEGSANKVKSALAAILKKGFLPTQIADSFAISLGGASFYRNRLNKYLSEGMSQADAENQTFLDFQELTESAQQSSRPDRISMQQAGPLGRVILAFQNTPMQYTRLIKKSVLDLINKRGDWKTNLSKILYYGAVQNIIFHSLQTALFALAFDEEEEEEVKNRYFNIGNRVADSVLIGTGVYGAIAATTKNVILEIIDQEKSGKRDFEKAAIASTQLSPPISSKLQKLIRAGRRFTYKQERALISEMGLSTRNPAVISAGEVLSAVFNLPADRAIRKWNNLVLAADSETELWQSIALTLGYSEWDVKLAPSQQTPQPKIQGLKPLKGGMKELKPLK
jgi:hypothetical protein